MKKRFLLTMLCCVLLRRPSISPALSLGVTADGATADELRRTLRSESCRFTSPLPPRSPRRRVPPHDVGRGLGVALGVALGAGATRLPPQIANLSECAARCRSCARCNFVSFSEMHHDCSWYRTCRFDDLNSEPCRESAICQIPSQASYVHAS